MTYLYTPRLVGFLLVTFTFLNNGRSYDPIRNQQAQNALDWFKSGVELTREGRHQDALVNFKKARELSPRWALPHLEIAVGHLKTDNDRKEIQRSLEKAVELGSGIPRAHYLYGVFLLDAGQHDCAQEQLKEALRLRPSLVEARFRLANLLLEKGDQPSALEQYAEVLAERPGHLGTHRNLALLYEQVGQLEKAEQHLTIITKLFPTNPFYLNQLGKFYERLGWNKKAAQTFQRAQRLEPDQEKRKLRPLPRSRYH